MSKRSYLRNSAIASGLVTKEQIDQATAVLRESNTSDTAVEVTDDRLAEKLVEMELLTSYQAAQLRAGRTKMNLGPYIITDFIGQGGMGQVFKATHRMMGRDVAIKVLPHARSTPEAIAGFTREIRAQASLDHEGLVRAHDAGHDGNVYFLVTEYVPGTDLRRLVRSQGPLTMQQAASIIMQAARGLQHAHDNGLVHRDVKPGNILVAPNGKTKVSDLGLAGSVDDDDDAPRAGKIVGTADYLSPEQIKTPREVTAAADIYSLGCTLYYSVTGKVPFPGGTSADKARRQCSETPWHPRRFNPDVDEEFVEIIADMMEKETGDRIASANEVAARLAPWAASPGDPPPQKMGRSPWTEPPLPSGSDADDPVADELEDTDPGSEVDVEPDAKPNAPPRRRPPQASQGTRAVATDDDDTAQVRRTSSGTIPPPPIPQPPPPPTSNLPLGLSRETLIALAIAVPAATLLAGLATLVLLWILW